MSRDMVRTCVGSLFACGLGLVVAGGVEDELADEFAGVFGDVDLFGCSRLLVALVVAGDPGSVAAQRGGTPPPSGVGG